MPSGSERLEFSALYHVLQHCGDLAFFAVEYIENLPQLVPLLFNLIAKIQESQGAYDDRQNRDFFGIYGISWLKIQLIGNSFNKSDGMTPVLVGSEHLGSE